MRVNKYLVEWKHHQKGVENRDAPPSHTICTIWEVQDSVLAHGKHEVGVMKDGAMVSVSSARAELAPRDNFCKNIGRKLSMYRALRKTKFNKELRQKFWNAYFEMRGKKW